MKKRKLLFSVLAFMALMANAETRVLPIFSNDYTLSSGDEAWYYIRFDYQNNLGYYLYVQCNGDVQNVTQKQKVSGSNAQLWKFSTLSAKESSSTKVSLTGNHFICVSKSNSVIYGSGTTMMTNNIGTDNYVKYDWPFYLSPYTAAKFAATYPSSWYIQTEKKTGYYMNASGGVKVDNGVSLYKEADDPGDALSFHLYEYDRAVSTAAGTKYGTICLPVATTVSTDNNTKIFTISGFKDGDKTKLYLTAETATDSKYTLAAGTPYIFSTTATDKVAFIVVSDEDADVAAASSSNGLVGTLPSSSSQTTTITQSASNYYVLHNNAWYKVGSANGTATTTFDSGAGRAYLDLSSVPTINNAKDAIFMDVDDSGTTAIESATMQESKPTGVYNLQGKRMKSDISSMPQGVYIVNGKKIVK